VPLRSAEVEDIGPPLGGLVTRRARRAGVSRQNLVLKLRARLNWSGTGAKSPVRSRDRASVFGASRLARRGSGTTASWLLAESWRTPPGGVTVRSLMNRPPRSRTWRAPAGPGVAGSDDPGRTTGHPQQVTPPLVVDPDRDPAFRSPAEDLLVTRARVHRPDAAVLERADEEPRGREQSRRSHRPPLRSGPGAAWPGSLAGTADRVGRESHGEADQHVRHRGQEQEEG